MINPRIKNFFHNVILSEAKNLGSIKWLSPNSFAMLWMAIILTFLLPSCITEDVPDNTPRGNFEALWHIIDTKYCFHEYKHQEYGLDWDEVYQRYINRLTDHMTDKQLFQVL